MKLIFVIIFCMLSATVMAGTDAPTCVNFKQPPFSGHIPNNFMLMPPCSGATYLIPEGNWLFVGDATITGSVLYEDTITFGPYAEFVADEKSKPLLPSRVDAFRLTEMDFLTTEMGLTKDTATIRDFHLPALKEYSGGCWVAPASVRIKRIKLINDDTDNSGIYLPEYTVLSVGKYHACKK